MDRRQDGMAAASLTEHPATPRGNTSAPSGGDAEEGGAMRHAAADHLLPASVCMAWTATSPASRATGSARRRHRTTAPAVIRASRPLCAVRPTMEELRRS